MTPEQQQQFEQWLATRPPKVREVARKYPPGTKFRIHGRLMWAMSYGEDGSLQVTPIDPAEDYERAVAERKPLCPCCTGNLDSIREP